MEQEGVYYYFEHEKDKHTAVFADSPAAHQPFPKYEKLTFSALTSIHEHDQEHVYDWVHEGRHHTGKYQHTDYHFATPNADLKTPESNPGNFAHSDFEIFDYPGEYDQRSDGEQWSRIRMEELRADRETFQGGGDVTGLATGRKFTLSQGPSPADVGEYLVIASSIYLQSNIYESGTSGGMGESYHCTFTAIKAADQFRPARLTPKPVIQGVQTAVVTGPKGEEIYTDKYGQIKVQFHWDREGKHDENTTCWIRVATPWAGQNWGGISIPRIGQEVVVAFLEGDPDQPLVVGSVYNAKQMPPYGLPNAKVVSGLKSNTHKGKGYNEMSMDDTAGKEKITIHGQYDMGTTVEHDDTQTVHNDRSITVDGKHTETIKKDTTIKITEGKLDHDVVAGTAKYHVQGAVIEFYEDKQTTEVTKEIAITSDTSSIYIHGCTNIQLHVGASKLWMADDGNISLEGVNVTIKGSASVTIKGGVVHSEAESEHQTKGAIVLSEGSGTNTVKGGMVMLNP